MTVANVFTTIAGDEIVWTDSLGFTHLVEGADVHDRVRLWARCASGGTSGRHRCMISVGDAWLRSRGVNRITCPACREIGSRAP